MPNGGNFDDRMKLLAEQVGKGSVRGDLVRDQAYAAYQHERELEHPNGGQRFYQSEPLMSGFPNYMNVIARQIAQDFDVVAGMDDALDAFEKDVIPKVPVDLTILRRSGHRQVLANGRVVRDHPPEVPRLSDEELREGHSDRALTGDEADERRARISRGEGRDSDTRELERGRVDPVRGEYVTKGDYTYVRDGDARPPARGPGRRREGERRRREGER